MESSTLLQAEIRETYNGLFLLIIDGEDYGSYLDLRDAKNSLIKFLKMF